MGLSQPKEVRVGYNIISKMLMLSGGIGIVCKTVNAGEPRIRMIIRRIASCKMKTVHDKTEKECPLFGLSAIDRKEEISDNIANNKRPTSPKD